MKILEMKLYKKLVKNLFYDNYINWIYREWNENNWIYNKLNFNYILECVNFNI